MTTQMPPTADALKRGLFTPSRSWRLATLVLSGLGLFVPGFYVLLSGHDFSTSVAKALPLAWVFPVLVALALIASLVGALARYARFIDLFAAIAGIVVSVKVISTLRIAQFGVQLQARMDQASSTNGASTATLNVGSYLVLIATLASCILVFAGFREMVRRRLRASR